MGKPSFFLLNNPNKLSNLYYYVYICTTLLKFVFMKIKLVIIFMALLVPKTVYSDYNERGAVNIDGVYYLLIEYNNCAYVTGCLKVGQSSYHSSIGTGYVSVDYEGDIIIPSSVTYNNKTYQVTRIEGEESGGLDGEYVNGAFYNCKKLTSVTVPPSIKSIGKNAFEGCTSLKAVYISDLSAWWNIEFSSNPLNWAGHLFLNGSEIKDLIIPNNVTSIKQRAFSGWNGLTSVTIPNSVTSIGKYAFSGCSGLTSVTIPNSVTKIMDYSFQDCAGLTNFVIPKSVTSIGENVFTGCTGLNKVEFHTEKIVACFSNIRSIKEIIIGSGATTIKKNAFSGCNGLTSITIPNSVISIEEKAFYGCTGLTSIEAIGTKSIYQNAFEDCSGLTSVTFGSSLTKIYLNAFKGCVNFCKFTCQSETPPTICDLDMLSELSFLENASLYVPTRSRTVYEKSKKGWNNFSKILPIDDKYILSCKVEGKISNTYEIKEGSVIDIYEPSKTGYTFFGWEGMPETMPDNDITVTAVFVPNAYKLTYMVDGEEYKAYDVNCDAKITPEEYPTKKGMTFSGWSGIPGTMPANDVIVTGTFSYSKSTIDGVIYQVTDTEKETAAVIGNNNATGSVTIAPTIGLDYTYKITAIDGKAFLGRADITSIEIPATVTTIGERTFANIDKLTDVTVHAEEIPETDRTAFENSYIEDYVTLHVPAGAVDKYKAAAPWKNFKEIVAIEESGQEDPEVPVGPQKCAIPTISFKDGKIMFACETEGVTFKYRVTNAEEKEAEGDEVVIDGVYNVSVYATKDGYEDSDVATKEIKLPTVKGDVNGDNKVDVADHVELSKIILKQEE